MKRFAPIAAVLALAACDQQQAPPAAQPESAEASAPAPAVKAEVPSLAGKWRVTTPAELDLAIGDGKAVLSSGCVRRAFTYKQTGNQVSFASSPSGSANCGSTPSAGAETAAAALADANLAVFGKDGRTVSLSGLGGLVAAERR